jgi:hypothetical protein
MGLSEDLHGLVEDAPPPTFELDQLMQHSKRWVPSRTVLAVTAFVAVALVVTGGYVLSAGRSPARHTTQVGGAPPAVTAPKPTPTKTAAPPPRDPVADRLTHVLAHLPANVRTALHIPATAKFVYFQVNNSPSQYTAQWSYHGVTYNILLMEGAQPNPGVNNCGPETGPQGDCQQKNADGGIIVNLSEPKGAAKYRTLNASFERFDGTSVEVWVNVTNRALILPASLITWLDKAASDPGFTLNP